MYAIFLLLVWHQLQQLMTIKIAESDAGLLISFSGDHTREVIVK